MLIINKIAFESGAMHYLIASFTSSTQEKVGFFESMQDMLGTRIILLILTVDTIRTILVALGWVHPDTPIIGKWLCGRRDQDIVKNVLLDMGYKEEKAKSSITDIRNMVQRKKQFHSEEEPLQVLDIVSRGIIKLDASITYGIENKSKSNYYINTMGIAHDRDCLKDMEKCLEKLVDNHCIKWDFIIVPKGGNPLLAQKLSAERDNTPFIMAKDCNDAARPGGASTNDLDVINFEGLEELLSKTKQKSRRLKGIVIDDNAAGGSQLLKAVKEFNEFVKRDGSRFEPIKYCFVLFKLTKKDSVTGTVIDDDLKFKKEGCTLYRYFDLDENDKIKIHSSKKRIDDTHSGTSNDAEHMRILKDVLKDISLKKRLYWKCGLSQDLIHNNAQQPQADGLSEQSESAAEQSKSVSEVNGSAANQDESVTESSGSTVNQSKSVEKDSGGESK